MLGDFLINTKKMKREKEKRQTKETQRQMEYANGEAGRHMIG